MQSFQLYVPGNSFLYRMDPRVKIITVAVVFVISVLFEDARFLAPVFLVVLLTAVIGKVPLSRVGLLLKSLTVLVIISMVMWPILYRSGTPWFDIAGFSVTREGVSYGVGMSFRILDMVIAPIVLFLTTPQADFVAALRKLGLPYRAAFTLNLAFRFLPTVSGVGQTIVEAQRARGLDPSAGGIAQRMRNYSRILGPLVITALRLAQQTILAVEARGFSIPRTRSTYREFTLAAADKMAIAIVMVGLATAMWLRIRGFGTL